MGMAMHYLPGSGGLVQDEDAVDFSDAMSALPQPILAYCRTGTLWSLAQANNMLLADILSATKSAGYDMKRVVRRIANGGKTPVDQADIIV
jgi:sulfide:quinone oxidoreductase